MTDFETALLNALEDFTGTIRKQSANAKHIPRCLAECKCENAIENAITQTNKNRKYEIGEIITRGQYYDLTDNGEIVQAPIDWIIVETHEDGTTIAIANKVLDYVPFDSTTVDYGQSYLKKFIELYFGENAFIPSERQLNSWFENRYGRETNDTAYACAKRGNSDALGHVDYWTCTILELYPDPPLLVGGSAKENMATLPISYLGVRPAIKFSLGEEKEGGE